MIGIAGKAVRWQRQHRTTMGIGATEQTTVSIGSLCGFLLLSFSQTSFLLGPLGFGLLLKRQIEVVFQH